MNHYRHLFRVALFVTIALVPQFRQDDLSMGVIGGVIGLCANLGWKDD